MKQADKAGFGIIGLGTWGVKHARVYNAHPDARLVAVCDTVLPVARDVAGRFNVDTYTDDCRELFDNPEIDAVSIVTPDFAHADLVMQAAAAGKHILVEKPLATTVKDAKRMAQAAEDAGVTLMVDFHNRWNPAFYQAREAIRNGEVGRPVSAHIKLHDTIFVPTKMLSWASRSSVLWFLGSHGTDLLRWIFDSEIETVYCVATSGVLTDRGINTPDVFHTTYRFRNGAVATMETGWILPESEPVIIDFKMDLACSDGAIKIDHSHNRALQTYTANRVDYPNLVADVEMYGKETGLTLDSIRHFVECVTRKQPPLVNAQDGIVNVQCLVAAEASANSGEPVTIADMG